jgi:hypothetical protein
LLSGEDSRDWKKAEKHIEKIWLHSSKTMKEETLLKKYLKKTIKIVSIMRNLGIYAYIRCPVFGSGGGRNSVPAIEVW